MLVHWLHSVRRDAVPVPRVDPDVIEASHTAELGEEGGNGVDVTETHPLSVALQPLGPMLDRVGAEQRPGLTQYGNERARASIHFAQGIRNAGRCRGSNLASPLRT